MWKALVKLVEKWSYRCDHEWELLRTSRVLDREMYKKGIEIASETQSTFICKKCLNSKKIIS